jgi:hypothetical protein
VLGATADQLAKTTGFIKRQRQLTGAKFVRALTLGCLPKPAATLEELTPSGVLNEVEMSPQGLDKRFPEEAATVLQPVLAEAVKTVVLAPPPVPIEWLNRFAAVWLALYYRTSVTRGIGTSRVWHGRTNHPKSTVVSESRGRFGLKTRSIERTFFVAWTTWRFGRSITDRVVRHREFKNR